ncbi:MAG: MBL fold metallo-hydrolase [Deltaproteobacteria bacterium]|nr:MBL fold metallo-hydrolase [Deltaproteobacteria bacterium]
MSDPAPNGAVRWLGHATALVELGGARFLTDPVLSRYVGMVVRRLAPAPPHVRELAPLDGVLVSHAHYDHLDLPSVRAIRRASGERVPPAVVLPGYADLVTKAGYPDVRTLAWYESTVLPCGARVTAIPAAHFGGRAPWRRRTGYGGFVIEHAGHTVMFAGDTGACDRYAEVGERFAIDVALLPIGAYSPPPFRRVHMAPEDALDGLVQLEARYLVPIHHATFRLSAEPMGAPARRLEKHARRRGLGARVALLRPGERFAIPPRAAS